jgi:hypothetical protein
LCAYDADVARLVRRVRDRLLRALRRAGKWWEEGDAGGALHGVVVFSRSDFLCPGTSVIVDWLFPGGDEAATTEMVAMAEQRATESKRTVLATRFPSLDPRFLKFQQLGFLAYRSNYFLVVISFDLRGTLFSRGQSFHTAGDSDLL